MSTEETTKAMTKPGSITLPVIPTSIELDAAWMARREQLLEGARKIEIVTTQWSFDEAEAALSRITKGLAELEKKRLALGKPFLDAGRAIKKVADEAGAPMEVEKARLKKVMTAYVEEVAAANQKALEEAAQAELEAQEKFAKEQAEAEAKRAKELADWQKAEDARIEAEETARLAAATADTPADEPNPFDDPVPAAAPVPVSVPIPPPAPIPQPVAPAPIKVVEAVVYRASSTVRKVWTFTITNASLVPRAFCTPDEKLIREAVNNGARAIDGIEIKEETAVASR